MPNTKVGAKRGLFHARPAPALHVVDPANFRSDVLTSNFTCELVLTADADGGTLGGFQVRKKALALWQLGFGVGGNLVLLRNADTGGTAESYTLGVGVMANNEKLTLRLVAIDQHLTAYVKRDGARTYVQVGPTIMDTANFDSSFNGFIIGSLGGYTLQQWDVYPLIELRQ